MKADQIRTNFGFLFPKSPHSRCLVSGLRHLSPGLLRWPTDSLSALFSALPLPQVLVFFLNAAGCAFLTHKSVPSPPSFNLFPYPRDKTAYPPLLSPHLSVTTSCLSWSELSDCKVQILKPAQEKGAFLQGRQQLLDRQ